VLALIVRVLRVHRCARPVQQAQCRLDRSDANVVLALVSRAEEIVVAGTTTTSASIFTALLANAVRYAHLLDADALFATPGRGALAALTAASVFAAVLALAGNELVAARTFVADHPGSARFSVIGQSPVVLRNVRITPLARVERMLRLVRSAGQGIVVALFSRYVAETWLHQVQAHADVALIIGAKETIVAVAAVAATAIVAAFQPLFQADGNAGALTLDAAERGLAGPAVPAAPVVAALQSLAIGNAAVMVFALDAGRASAALEATAAGILAALPIGLALGQARTVAGAGLLAFRRPALTVATSGRTVLGTEALIHLDQSAHAVAARAAVRGATLRRLVAFAFRIAARLQAVKRTVLEFTQHLPADAIPAHRAVHRAGFERFRHLAGAVAALPDAVRILAPCPLWILQVLVAAHPVETTTAIDVAEIRAPRHILSRFAVSVAASDVAVQDAVMGRVLFNGSAHPVTARAAVLGAGFRVLDRVSQLAQAVSAQRALPAILGTAQARFAAGLIAYAVTTEPPAVYRRIAGIRISGLVGPDFGVVAGQVRKIAAVSVCRTVRAGAGPEQTAREQGRPEATREEICHSFAPIALALKLPGLICGQAHHKLRKRVPSLRITTLRRTVHPRT